MRFLFGVEPQRFWCGLHWIPADQSIEEDEAKWQSAGEEWEHKETSKDLHPVEVSEIGPNYNRNPQNVKALLQAYM